MKLLTKSGKPVEKKYNYIEDYNEMIQDFLDSMTELDSFYDDEDCIDYEPLRKLKTWPEAINVWNH